MRSPGELNASTHLNLFTEILSQKPPKPSKMINRLLLAFVLLSPGWAAPPLVAQDIQVRGEHPRLFFTSERIADLRGRIKTEPKTAEAVAKILADPKSIQELSLAYRMTGERRFAEKARDAVGRLQWGDSMLMRRDPPWHSGLGTGHSCFESAIAFDSIYDMLTPEERQALASRIVERGIVPTLNDWVLGEKRIHALDSMGHNWWSACVFGAGMAALAVIDEEPRAKDWLRRISDGSVEWLEFAGSLLDNKPRSFDADGAFFEDVNYASFAVSTYLHFRLAWNNALSAPAAPEIPLLDNAGDYFLNVSYSNSGNMLNLNFGDSGASADIINPVIMLWANGYQKPRYLWHINEVRRANLRAGTNRVTPIGLVSGPSESELDSGPTAPDLPPSALYRDIGWATLRSSWDVNATLLGVISGHTWNHSHADAGSFVLYHRGENLLIDSGKSSYGRTEYDAYYRQSHAHNVVLFNGEAENPENTYFGSKFTGTVSNLIDGGDLKYVLADATGPTSQRFIRNYRQFLWLGDVILIIDDLKTFEVGGFEWLLHVDGEARQRGQDLEVVKGGAKVLVRPLFPMPLSAAGYPADFPENMRLVEKKGLKDREPDTEVTYYAFAAPDQSRRMKFITGVILVDEHNQASLPELERLEGPNYIGVRVRQNGVSTEVYLNLLADGSIMHRNANLMVNGWETDAYLTAITFPEGSDETDPDAASRYFVAQGSYLRRDGKVVLDSLSKLFMQAEYTPTALNVVIQGQPRINAYLRSLSAPKKLTVNGVDGDAPFDSGSKSLKITSGGE